MTDIEEAICILKLGKASGADESETEMIKFMGPKRKIWFYKIFRKP